MRLILSVLTAIFMWGILPAQAEFYNDEQIERYVSKTPRQVENNVGSLVDWLVKPFHNDYDKAHAIAFWIASRIYYDRYLYTDGQRTKLSNSYKSQTAQELLRSRVGICGDFADLFTAMCQRAGIQVGRINGYAFPAGVRLKSLANYGHAWNYFKYGAYTVYVDTTFMAQGKTDTEKLINNYNHKKALYQIKQKNRIRSQVNDFDPYYFNFSYKNEQKYRNYIHQEE